MDKEMNSKKGQIAIWVLLAILIVAVMIIIFYFMRTRIVVDSGQETNPKSYIEKCTRDAVVEAENKMLPQGGFLEPMNFKEYEGIKVTYMCQNTGNFNPCINQHPMFINELKEQIKNYITPIINDCYSSLKTDLENKKYSVSLSSMTIDVDLGPSNIFLDVNRKMRVTKNDNSESYDSFEIKQISPLYDLALVANEIANQEAKYCYFEYVGYMVIYPRFDIKKITMSDSTKIYTIKDTKTTKEMNIATRGCAIPAGI